MPNLKLETYKNKATGTVYDYTDAAAQASIAAIEEKIPNVASSENQLVTEAGLNNVLNFKEDKVPGKGLSTNDYDDTAKGLVDNIQSNVIANTKLIKDTVGCSAKNKAIMDKVEVGVAWNGTPNNDRARLIIPVESNKKYIVTIHGTNNLSGIFYAHSASIPASTIAEITSFPFIIVVGAGENYITLGFNRTNITLADIKALKLMVKDSDILDDTYEEGGNATNFLVPRSEQVVLGAKNLLPNNWSWEDTGTLGGITLTRNSNDTITVGAGTVSGGGGKWLFNTTLANLGIKKGRYKVTANIPSSLGGNVFFTIKDNTGNVTYNVTGSTQEVEFEVTDVNINHTWHIYTWFNNNTVLSESFVMQPMIRLASDTDRTFASYAMTNEQLTNKTAELYRYGGLNTNNFRIRLVTAEIAFVNGTGTYDLSSLANDFYSFALAAFQTYGSVWITSAHVENKILIVKARNNDGPFTSDGNAAIFAVVCEKL